MKIVTRDVKEAAKKLSADYETPERLQKEYDKQAEEYKKNDEKLRKDPKFAARYKDMDARDKVRETGSSLYKELEDEYKDRPADENYTKRAKLAKATMDASIAGIKGRIVNSKVKDWDDLSLEERYDSLMNHYKNLEGQNKEAEKLGEKLKKIKRSENKDEYNRWYERFMAVIKDVEYIKKEIRTLLKTEGMAEKIKEEAAKSKAKPSKEKITKALNEAIIRLEDGNGEDAKVALLEGIFGGDDWGAFHPDSNPPPFSTRNKIDFILIEENLKGDEAKKRRLELKRMSPEEIDKIYNSKKKK